MSITALHANIKDAQFDVGWFSQFDIVMNALDNLDARRHVNKMCMAANVPLIESGTAGYGGQVQPIKQASCTALGTSPESLMLARRPAEDSRMLRLSAQARRQDVPSLYDPLYAVHTHTLHRVGEELSLPVGKVTFLPYLGPERRGCSQLFGSEEENDDAELDDAAKQGESGGRDQSLGVLHHLMVERVDSHGD